MRQVLAGLLLTGLIAVLAWINLRNQIPTARPNSATVDQRFSDFTAIQYGQAGHAEWKLAGRQLEHMRQQGGYRIDDPTVEFKDRKQPGPPWVLTAPTGKADTKLTEVFLSGGVVGKRAPWQDHGQLNLATEQLTIEPKQRRASSKVETVVSETLPAKNDKTVWRSRSQGFALDYNSQILQQSRVDDWLAPREDTHRAQTRPLSPTPSANNTR